MTFSYDKEADVLYVTFDHPTESYIYVENESGDVLRLDKETKSVVGVTIPFFAKRAAVGPIIVPEVGLVPFNVLAEYLVTK